MRLLVTGASGFVGWNVVQYFRDRVSFVQPTFRSFPHYLHYHSLERVQTPVQLDITDRRAVEKVVSRFQPDYILHAAARARPQQTNIPDELYNVNVNGTANLARAASAVNSRLIFLSTDLVYPIDAGRVHEGSPTAPSGAGQYSQTKLLAEEQVKTLSNAWTTIRCTLMFGHGTPRSNSFTQFLEKKWNAGEPAPVFSDQKRSFLYIGDLLTALETVMNTQEAVGQLYVCGGAEHLSRSDFALRYAEACEVDPQLCNVMLSSELEGYVGGSSDIGINSSKLQSLGWAPRSLTECFDEMASNRGKFASST